MTYVEQTRSIYTAKSLSTFTGEDGAQLVLENSQIRYVAAGENKRGERVVPKQNAPRFVDLNPRVAAAEGNNTAVADYDVADLTYLSAEYDTETGIITISADIDNDVLWEVEAGTSPSQARKAEEFCNLVNQRVAAPKYAINDYNEMLHTAVEDQEMYR